MSISRGTSSSKESFRLQNAAVLALFYKKDGEEHLIFTRRTDKVLHHKGQICFPGGAADPADQSLWETALRETREEIGIDPKSVSLIRELPQQATPTGFLVTPFMASIPGPIVWTPNADEIAEIFIVPVSHLSNPRHVEFTEETWQGKKQTNAVFLYQHHRIWGVTGRILCNVLEITLPLTPQRTS